MPEGPSIVILKEEIDRLHLCGKKITGISGNTSLDLSQLLHQKVLHFKTWGKHFLICFKDCSIRIHLLMFGTYRINERKETAPRLRLEFKGAELNFYTCSVKLIEQDLDEVYDWKADIMSDQWDAKAALQKLQAQPEQLVCDALLDQDIFAGAGNIIRNEVLYRVKTDPRSKVGAIPPARLRALIKEVRDYSFDFLRWKKEYTLSSHWQAHKQKECGRCNLPMHKEYPGKTKRRSYFCTNCQVLFGD